MFIADFEMAGQGNETFVSLEAPTPVELTSVDEAFDGLFFVERIFETLETPFLISDFPKETANDLVRMKEKADANVLLGIQKILGLDITDITKVKSVFETPRFFNDILESCDKELSPNGDVEVEQTIEENSIQSADLGETTKKSPEPISESTACSLKSGHTELNPITCSNESNPPGDYNEEVESITWKEENQLKPIEPTPVTPNELKLIDVRKYMSQAKFCTSCASRNKPVFNFDDVISESTDNKALSRSFLKLNKMYRVKPGKSRTEEPPLKEVTESTILSPDISEGSNDSGMFQAYKSKTSLSPPMDDLVENIALPPLAITENKSSQEPDAPESVLGIENVSIEVANSEENRIENVSIEVANSNENRIENVSIEVANSDENHPDCHLDNLRADLHKVKGTETTTRKVFLTEKKEVQVPSMADMKEINHSIKALLKAKKKKKRRDKRLKEKKKASIHLSPPPGVDMDEYLQQQLFSIKAQLESQNDSDEYSSENDKKSKNCSNVLTDLHDDNDSLKRALESLSPVSESSDIIDQNNFNISQKRSVEKSREISDGYSTKISLSGSPQSSSSRQIDSPRHRTELVKIKNKSRSPYRRSSSGSPRRRSASLSPRRGNRFRRRSPSPRSSRYRNNEYRRRQRSRSNSLSPPRYRSSGSRRYRNYDRSRMSPRFRPVPRGSKSIREKSPYRLRSPIKEKYYRSRVTEVERKTTRNRFIDRYSRSPSPRDRRDKRKSPSGLSRNKSNQRSSKGVEIITTTTVVKEYEKFEENLSLSTLSSPEESPFQRPPENYYIPPMVDTNHQQVFNHPVNPELTYSTNQELNYVVFDPSYPPPEF